MTIKKEFVEGMDSSNGQRFGKAIKFKPVTLRNTRGRIPSEREPPFPDILPIPLTPWNEWLDTEPDDENEEDEE